MRSKVGTGLLAAGYQVGLAATGSLAFVWAGAPAQAQPMPVPYPQPFNSWSIGGGIGVDMFRVPMSIESYDYYNSDSFSGTPEGSGFFGTVEIGRDFRNGNTVFGLYADYAYGNKTAGVASQVCNYYCLYTNGVVSLDHSVSLIGRVGMVTHPTTLLYGLAGLTWQHYSARIRAYSEWQGQTRVTTRQGDLGGLLLGVGAETLLHPNWSLKGEYRLAHFESIGRLDDYDCCIELEGRFGAVTDHIFRVVLSYKAP
jgi:opacity protein-like surface antigen